LQLTIRKESAMASFSSLGGSTTRYPDPTAECVSIVRITLIGIPLDEHSLMKFRALAVLLGEG